MSRSDDAYPFEGIAKASPGTSLGLMEDQVSAFGKEFLAGFVRTFATPALTLRVINICRYMTTTYRGIGVPHATDEIEGLSGMYLGLGVSPFK
ncbi:hypothetical protein [Parasedimentitalea maritima]|nr:hypothetical protein [Zongyanglinia marina]